MTLLSLATLLTGCTPHPLDSGKAGAGDTAGDSGGDSGRDSGGLDASTVYYFGTSDGQTPDGSYDAPPLELLFIRTVDPAASLITEQFWQEPTRGTAWSTGLIVNAVDATALTFGSTWDTGDGEIEIVGTFTEGDPWAWTAWHSTSTYLGGRYQGTTVTSDDQLDGAGADTADKHVYDEHGTETYQIIEIITPTEQSAFEARLAEIGG